MSEAAADEHRVLVGPLSAALHLVPAETSAVFGQLETWQQARLLRRNWRRFAYPSFLPMVRRATSLAYAPEVVDIALRRLFQLSPSEGRAAILAEVARPASRVSIETVRGLPDTELPELESTWVHILERSVSPDAVLRAASRLERFGTPASASAVERAWRTRHADWPLDADPPVIAFLARVAPAAATGVLLEALAEPDEAGGVGRDEPLLMSIGRLHWSAEVEAVAVAALADRQFATAAGGAEALRHFGSASARQAIEDALVKVRQAALDEPVNPRREGDAERLEGRFATALNHALRWTLSERVRALWRRGCIRSACRDAMADPRRDTDPPWHVEAFQPSDDEGMKFGVGDLHVDSVDALVEKLRHHPNGTRVHLRLPWPSRRGAVGSSHEFFTERDVATLFETVRSRAAAVGIDVVRDYTVAR